MMPREKLIEYGVESLTSDELLSIIIGSGTRSENVFKLAKRIIGDDDVRSLLRLTYEDLMKIKGIKEAKATKIISAIELSKRIFSYVPNDFTYNKASSIFNFLKSFYLGKTTEDLIVIYFDSSLHIICKKLIATGTIDAVTPSYQLIFKYAFQYGSEQIIIAHNHPSGRVEPSDADIAFTAQLYHMCKELNILLLDHIIVGNDKYYSFAANNNLKNL